VAAFCFCASFALAQQPGGEKAADKSADKTGEKAKEDKKAAGRQECDDEALGEGLAGRK